MKASERAKVVTKVYNNKRGKNSRDRHRHHWQPVGNKPIQCLNSRAYMFLRVFLCNETHSFHNCLKISMLIPFAFCQSAVLLIRSRVHVCIVRAVCLMNSNSTPNSVWKIDAFFPLQRILLCICVSTVCLVQNWSNRMQMVRNCFVWSRMKVLFPLLLINVSYCIFEDGLES